MCIGMKYEDLKIGKTLSNRSKPLVNCIKTFVKLAGSGTLRNPDYITIIANVLLAEAIEVRICFNKEAATALLSFFATDDGHLKNLQAQTHKVDHCYSHCFIIIMCAIELGKKSQAKKLTKKVLRIIRQVNPEYIGAKHFGTHMQVFNHVRKL